MVPVGDELGGKHSPFLQESLGAAPDPSTLKTPFMEPACGPATDQLQGGSRVKQEALLEPTDGRRRPAVPGGAEQALHMLSFLGWCPCQLPAPSPVPAPADGIGGRLWQCRQVCAWGLWLGGDFAAGGMSSVRVLPLCVPPQVLGSVQTGSQDSPKGEFTNYLTPSPNHQTEMQETRNSRGGLFTRHRSSS